jgi:hypothetical protein
MECSNVSCYRLLEVRNIKARFGLPCLELSKMVLHITMVYMNLNHLR